MQEAPTLAENRLLVEPEDAERVRWRDLLRVDLFVLQKLAQDIVISRTVDEATLVVNGSVEELVDAPLDQNWRKTGAIEAVHLAAIDITIVLVPVLVPDADVQNLTNDITLTRR